MKRAGELWKHLGASNSIAGRIGRALLYIVVAVLAYQCVTLRFDWKQQAIVGTLTLLIGLALYTFSQAYVATLMLIVASMLTICRYAVWRVTQVYEAVSDPSSNLRHSMGHYREALRQIQQMPAIHRTDFWLKMSPVVCSSSRIAGPVTVTFDRQPVEDSQLSYAGFRDPGSVSPTYGGNIWGGVIANAGSIQINRGDAPSGWYISGGGQYITGKPIRSNTRFDGYAGAYWSVWNRPEYGKLTLGMNLFRMHFANNQRLFT